jgi:hypothetical protein
MKNYSMLLISALSLVSVNSFAGGGSYSSSGAEIHPKSSNSMIVNMTILDSTILAPISDIETLSYSVRTNTSKTITDIKGTGVLRQATNRTEEEKTQVMGKDIKGYQQLIIKPLADNKLTFEMNTDIVVSDQNVTVPFKDSISVDGYLTEGTWEDFKLGRTVKFKMTEAGEKLASKSTLKNLLNTVDITLNSSLKQISRSVYSKSQLQNIKDSSTLCLVNLKELSCRSTNNQFKLIFDVYGL